MMHFFACRPLLEKQFKSPPDRYKPMPFWHINGELTTEGIRQQMRDAREAGFSGVSLLPLATRGKRVGTSPAFLSEAYFDRFQDMLDVARELEMEIILYDDNDFPSGMAGGKLQDQFPDHTMKRLDKIEKIVTGRASFIDTIRAVKLMAAVAMNLETLERIEISDFLQDSVIRWEVPDGSWKIMLFDLMKDSFHKKYLCVDFLDTTAVRHMINLTYDRYAERFGSYFGNTIKMTFFDDVGFWRHPRTWTGRFNAKFAELHGYDPKPYYPALWYDIGPGTEAVRHAFYHTRAELLAEGFPKLAAQWNTEHGLKSTGHPPGNYDPTPIDMNGDIFKFFRYTQIPLTDAIIDYQFGQNGHKLISSAADYYDRPVVSTEIYGAYKEAIFDTMMLYRPMMDLFIRGINLVVPHGLWYNPNQVYIPPLVSPYSEKISAALPDYVDFVGRSSLLLRGGRRVSEIAVMYPFEELAGWYRFEDPENPRQGFFISPETDYMEISGFLTNDIRRDFTFIHPEYFLDEKYIVEKGSLYLDNQENFQRYQVIILTGCKIISHRTLAKIRDFYNQGGRVVSTTQLPFMSSERGEDQKVIDLIQEIFGIDPLQRENLKSSSRKHESGGISIFIPTPTQQKLASALKDVPFDVGFDSPPVLETDFGKFSYIHKVRDGRDIYYFANSSDETIKTQVLLRGRRELQRWDPHHGIIDDVEKWSMVELDGQRYTKGSLTLEPVSSVFWMTN
ncbi:MAG: hypothetical protein HKN87_08505 [Saprospiraceae bacterium]|nr:hypothetical protein [Saprospiraceae bacterium]